MQRAMDIFEAHLPELVEDTVERVLADRIPFYLRMPRDAVKVAITRAFQAAGQDVARGTFEAFPGLMAAIGRQRVEQGANATEIIAGMDLGFAMVSELFERHFGGDLEVKLWWERQRHRVSHTGAIKLWESMLVARDEVIGAQAAELHRLGATIVPLHRQILLLPLVGTVDARRAEQIMSALLEAIVARQAAVVIIDVTGVPAVDADVMRHLVGAAQATRLLGAEPVVVGISPDIAQTMVELGIELQGLTVRGTLEDGVELALGRLGKAIVERRRAR